MCGIVGAIYGPAGAEADGWTESEAAEQLLWYSIHRGSDATGYMFPDVDVEIRKAAIPADEFVTDGLVSIPTVPWWFGHVRFSTRGTPKYNGNNHPIKHKDIVGIHNGTIYNDDEILKITGREDPAAEVDSEAIFAAIHHLGVKKGLRSVTGGAAVAFVDRTNLGRVYLARVRNYPLVIAKSKAGNFYFGSEMRILNELGLEWEKTWKVKEGRLIVFENGKIRSFKKFMDEPKKVQRSTPKQGRGITSVTEDADYKYGYLTQEPEFENAFEWAQWHYVRASDTKTKLLDGRMMTEREYYMELMDEYALDTEMLHALEVDA